MRKSAVTSSGERYEKLLQCFRKLRSSKVGLPVNEDKTNIVVSAIDNRYNFEIVGEFIYLGSAVCENDNVRLKKERGIVLV